MKKISLLVALGLFLSACGDNDNPYEAQVVATEQSSGDARFRDDVKRFEGRQSLIHHPSLFGMLVRNNNMRRRAGLRGHRIHPTLTAAAQDHANYMAKTGQFSHYVNGSPSSRAQKYGWTGGVLENIATGGGLDNAFGMWQNSGAHYASIVSDTSDAGFGYAIGANGATYYVGVYATAAKGNEGETEEQVAEAVDAEKKKAEEAKPAETEKPDPLL